MNEDIIIGECELPVTLLITLLWGMNGRAPRILIICTDNMNAFEWLTGWRAKVGCANRMLQALIDFLIEKGIEIIPRYVRSGRDFSCDFLPRSDATQIDAWETRMKMERCDLPVGWRRFCEKWTPGEDRKQGVQIDLKRALREDGSNISACGWRPASYAFVRACREYGCKVFIHEPDHYGLGGQIGEVLHRNQQHIDILMGMAWTDLELSDFAHSVAQICPTSDVAITPHALRDPPLLMMRWKECVFVDSSCFGSVRNQVWRLYIWGQLEVKSLLLEPEYRSTQLLGQAYEDAGFGNPKDEMGVTRVIPFEQSLGLTVLVDSERTQRYSISSHIPMLTLREIRGGQPQRPVKNNGEEPSNRDKIIILGGIENGIYSKE